MRILFLPLVMLLQCKQLPILQTNANIASPTTDSMPTNAAPRSATGEVAANIIFQSSDGGASWQDMSAGLPIDLNPGRVLIQNGTISLSTDKNVFERGNSMIANQWTQTMFMLGNISQMFPAKSGRLISRYGQGLYQNMPGTDILMPLADNLTDKKIRCAIELPDETLVVGCESGIYKSADRGKTWKKVFTSDMGLNDLARLEDGTLASADFQGILCSKDNGETWAYTLEMKDCGFRVKRTHGHGFIALPQGYKNNVLKKDRLCVSDDAGLSWHSIDMGLPAVESIFDAIQLGTSYYCSTEKGVFKTTDGGKTWMLIFDTPLGTDRNFMELETDGQVIFAVPVGGC